MKITKELLSQLEQWHQDDEYKNIIDTINNLPNINDELKGHLGRAYNNRHMLDKALKILLEIKEEHRDEIWKFRVGYAYFYKKEYKNSLKYFSSCCEFIEEKDEDTLFFIRESQKAIQEKPMPEKMSADVVQTINRSDDSLQQIKSGMDPSDFEDGIIKTKSDILIPFKKIPDNKWIENIRLILGDSKIEPIAESEIKALENRLGTSLPVDLKMFYKEFGIADIGEELRPLDKIEFLIETWKDNPQYGPSFTEEEKITLPHLVVFSDYLGNGNMFCFHIDTKEIYYFDHDGSGYLTKLFSTASDYIKGCLIAFQADFPASDEAEEHIEDWCEEILFKLFGKSIVKKWRY